MRRGGNRTRRVHRKRWLSYRARKRFLNPRIKPYRPRSAAEIAGSVNDYTRASVRGVGIAPVEVILPSSLDFEENFESTASHFRLVRDGAKACYKIRRLGFENITSISPAAALALASEVDRWKVRSPRIRAATDTWDPEVKRLLCEMGYFELLNLPLPEITLPAGKVRFLRFLSGLSNPKDKGQIAVQLRKNIEEVVGVGVVRTTVLYHCLSEAITNVIDHAYPGAVGSQPAKPWWLSASFDQQTRKLTVLAYDHGVGIPATLPPTWFESAKDVFKLWPDSRKIEAAATYGRSQTAQQGRGKGLARLQEFAKAYDEGTLSIYSHRGLYRLSHGSEGKIVTTRRDHEQSVGGTLIEWAVRL